MNPLVKVENLSKYYFKNKKIIRAIDQVNFEIFPKETVGLVGESGCGKSTIAHCLLKLINPSGGKIEYDGKQLGNFNKKETQSFRKNTGMIFQDPYASLNPRMIVGEIIAEPLRIHRMFDKKKRKQRVLELLDLVGLSKASTNRFPHEFSGGQRQRIGIARALAIEPEFIIGDEPISALDVSVQAQIINLFKQIQSAMGLTYLFIAHDLRVVKYLSDRIAVMYMGSLMEIAPAENLYKQPQHPYTQALLSAIPIPDPAIERKRKRIVLSGEMPKPHHPIRGCPFASRCHYVIPKCYRIKPKLTQVGTEHKAACHLVGKLEERTLLTTASFETKGSLY